MKFKKGDKVKFTLRGKIDHDIGIVKETTSTHVWVMWREKTALPYFPENLILVEKKQNHPHTTIFK